MRWIFILTRGGWEKRSKLGQEDQTECELRLRLGA